MSVILIVEDNERNLKLVRDVLQVKGYSTLEAVTARICVTPPAVLGARSSA